ncbi:NADH-ubiquinone dehydrogenase [Mesorhizobium sp. VNQ89]|uniref:NADH-ubiquinone dehydrogenase n=1 Tax=Mesorhizobium quangtriensis TaxID=3157709 RepID=UPI0032B7E526
MVEAKRKETVTEGMATVLPTEMASAVNLFAHPFAGVAAASAVGIGLASQAFGFWMGAISGMAEASQRVFVPQDAKPATANSVAPKARSAATKARTATKVLIEETQSAALEIAGDVAAKADVPPLAEKAVDLQPEDFRQPKSLAKPKKADDLKAIAGIGPKLEKVLNELGVWTYSQIAGWTAEEIAWVDDYLSFTGRIERDNWTGQAAALAGKKKR